MTTSLVLASACGSLSPARSGATRGRNRVPASPSSASSPWAGGGSGRTKDELEPLAGTVRRSVHVPIHSPRTGRPLRTGGQREEESRWSVSCDKHERASKRRRGRWRLSVQWQGSSLSDPSETVEVNDPDGVRMLAQIVVLGETDRTSRRRGMNAKTASSEPLSLIIAHAMTGIRDAEVKLDAAQLVSERRAQRRGSAWRDRQRDRHQTARRREKRTAQ